MSLKHYETVFILNPVLSEKETKDAVAKYKKLLKDKGAKMVHEENLGPRKLAYPIKQKSTGVYQLFEFQAPSDIVAGMEIAFKRDENVLRFLTVSLDKHGVAYNDQRRKWKANNPEKATEETKEEVSKPAPRKAAPKAEKVEKEATSAAKTSEAKEEKAEAQKAAPEAKAKTEATEPAAKEDASN